MYLVQVLSDAASAESVSCPYCHIGRVWCVTTSMTRATEERDFCRTRRYWLAQSARGDRPTEGVGLLVLVSLPMPTTSRCRTPAPARPLVASGIENLGGWLTTRSSPGIPTRARSRAEARGVPDEARVDMRVPARS